MMMNSARIYYPQRYIIVSIETIFLSKMTLIFIKYSQIKTNLFAK